MPAPPTPIDARTARPRATARRGWGCFPGAGRSAIIAPTSSHELGEALVGIGRRPCRAAAAIAVRRRRRPPAPRMRLASRSDDRSALQRELGRPHGDEFAGVRLLMVLGGVRVGHEDRRDPAVGEFGDVPGARTGDREVGDRERQLDAIEERHRAHEQRRDVGRRRRDHVEMVPAGQHDQLQVVAMPQMLQRARHDLVEMQRTQAPAEHRDGRASGLEVERGTRLLGEFDPSLPHGRDLGAHGVTGHHGADPGPERRP